MTELVKKVVGELEAAQEVLFPDVKAVCEFCNNSATHIAQSYNKTIDLDVCPEHARRYKGNRRWKVITVLS